MSTVMETWAANSNLIVLSLVVSGVTAIVYSVAFIRAVAKWVRISWTAWRAGSKRQKSINNSHIVASSLDQVYFLSQICQRAFGVGFLLFNFALMIWVMSLSSLVEVETPAFDNFKSLLRVFTFAIAVALGWKAAALSHFCRSVGNVRKEILLHDYPKLKDEDW